MFYILINLNDFNFYFLKSKYKKCWKNNTISTIVLPLQAHTVEKELNDLGYKTEIVAVKSLETSSWQTSLRVRSAVFTKTLDFAMINGDVDMRALHERCSHSIANRNCSGCRIERAGTLIF
jgi:hypothetical protein